MCSTRSDEQTNSRMIANLALSGSSSTTALDRIHRLQARQRMHRERARERLPRNSGEETIALDLDDESPNEAFALFARERRHGHEADPVAELGGDPNQSLVRARPRLDLARKPCGRPPPARQGLPPPPP